MKIKKKKFILGHRGYCERAPENTYLSFQAAESFAFDGVEMDLHMTKDRKLVIVHDETIDRTSDGHGYIKDQTLKQLRKYDFSAKFKNECQFQKIMTYEEFLIAFGDSFKIINVELKTDVIHYSGIEKMVLDITKWINPKAQIIYSSFNINSIKILRALDQKAHIGFLFVKREDLEVNETIVKKSVDYLHPWWKITIKNENAKYFASFEKPINVWTIDKRPNYDIWSKGSYEKLPEMKKLKNGMCLIANSKLSE